MGENGSSSSSENEKERKDTTEKLFNRNSSDSELEEEVEIKTKTLADLDEGDPWTEKGNERDNAKNVGSENSDENNQEEMLQHLDSDDLPAQDDMSHRAVFGDDDDRNDDDVLLLDENEEETKERENENRKLSTTVPSLMEENESMGLKDVKDNPRENIDVKSDEEVKQKEPVSTSDLLTDKS